MNPYEKLDAKAFWKSGVAISNPMDISGLAVPKQRLHLGLKIGTAGSCFAQHIARHLKANGFNFVDAEPAPDLLSETRHAPYGYGLYSARYGNVYTAAQLHQLVMRSCGRFSPAEAVWESNGRYYDPFRPTIEPDGFASADEVKKSAESHLRAVRRMLSEIDVFIFTLGLTEAWRSKVDQAVFPICPGTLQRGTFDENRHEFVNFTFNEIRRDLLKTFKFINARINPKLKFLLTVSPVPLTATASGEHVLTATTYSKSVLRAVAGQLSAEMENVSYFPSYEIITAPVFKGRFYEPNLRSVLPEGVEFVMRTFLKEFCEVDKIPATTNTVEAPRKTKPESTRGTRTEEDVWCDEEVLEFYAK